PDRYPDAFFREAWKLLVLNSAHDSSCACSADEVVEHVAVRYAQARQIGDGITRDAMHAAAAVDAPAGATVVVNPTAHDRSGIVECTVPGAGPLHFVDTDGIPRPTQVIDELGGEGYVTMVTGEKVRWVLDLMRGTEFAGRQVTSYEWRRDAAGVEEVVLQQAGPGDDRCDLGELREAMLARGVAGATMRVRLLLAPFRRAVVDTGPVPGFGWSTLLPRDGASPSSALGVDVDGARLFNEHLSVVVDRADGTYSITTTDGVSLPGLGRLVDGGDGGDTYNYSPPDVDEIIDRPHAVVIEPTASGPVRASIRVTSTYDWPTHAIGDERSCSARADTKWRVVVRTTLELRNGERFLRVHHELDNQCRDHRLRAHFPLPSPVTHSDAECAFAVVRRGLTAEGGAHEHGLPTFPSRRFVDCSDGDVGVALVHDGLLEYEVVDDGRELALTLLRATGYLSRAEPALRPNPAGPTDPVEGAQVLGRQVADYAVVPHRGDWRAAALPARADEFLVALERVRAQPRPPSSSRPATGRALRVDGAEVSAVLRERGRLVVRVVRTDPEVGPVTIERAGVPAHGWIVDLRGRPITPVEGSFELAPWQIATVVLS
ncbi:MAG TPA: glycoside hydrolase family 38 C-terminal domain-containing protein, partial [Acidimicrobiia bacterium]|nr:glycoside hydrolase family 38 C-terminal domain-containing protein [Acidimicrobiia bacterium]